MVSSTAKRRRQLKIALLFLAPNIIGFLVFTLFPLVASFALAFTNWDLRLHNMFRDEPLRFVGLEHVIRLFTEDDFVRFLGNTAYLMLGIPVGIAGSLGAALLLSDHLKGRNKVEHGAVVKASLVAAVLLLLAVVGLMLVGAHSSAMFVIMSGLLGLFLVGGSLGGSTLYRTLFYLPHFTSGVAVFLLWKKLYNPTHGPVNTALAPLLDGLSSAVNAVPAGLFVGFSWACVFAAVLVFAWAARKLASMWADGEAGIQPLSIALLLLSLPVALCWAWTPAVAGVGYWPSWVFTVGVVLAATALGRRLRTRRLFVCDKSYGAGTSLVIAVLGMVSQLFLLGAAALLSCLPDWAGSAQGLTPPNWLTDYNWAKPAIMLMALWAAIGSNNMLMYLAGLSNVPQELYEAADIDGATRLQRFWHVTWPQLAPVTFFILIMATIHGLQGGFEMARTMTGGGPAGSTTTLSYYVYTEGFVTGRLGFASAVAWTLFAMVFVLTLVNWKFGTRYVNE